MPHTTLNRVITASLTTVAVVAGWGGISDPVLADPIESFAAEYCLDCHGHDNAEAHVNLEALLASPKLDSRFRVWEKIREMVSQKNMPPEDMPQPNDRERRVFTHAIGQQLDKFVSDHGGDPGRVVMRRLTSAEYAYTIEELTGLQLDLHAILIDDAVGGEGFTNVGEVQFLQESTLERYLEAAKLVADHAVIGTGPLQFFRDPGKTGLELSAIDRVQQMYRDHGFRTGAGEGGEPFGLDLYPRAFFVAWKYHHRHRLGLAAETLGSLARAEGIAERFAEHIYHVLNEVTPSFPSAEIVTAWHQLPVPGEQPDAAEIAVRVQCEQLADELRSWQRRLANSAGDDEEAALLSHQGIQLSPTFDFRASIDWEEGAQVASVVFEVASAGGDRVMDATVIWRKPTLRFRQADRRPSQPIALGDLLHNAVQLPRGPVTDASEEQHDFVVGPGTTRIEFRIPDGATAARLTVAAELRAAAGKSSIVRCTVRDGSKKGDTAADTGEISAILGIPEGPDYARWQRGVFEFARNLPDVSHREPAPSDRDPIPAPFDNRYNTAERNEFHYTIKYHRDDEFLVTHLLDQATRQQLDEAWQDLLSSFDYHATFIAFIARKNQLDWQTSSGIDVPPAWLESLPAEHAVMVRQLQRSYREILDARRAAEPQHVADVLNFAQAAWRRPLAADEQDRLRQCYTELRGLPEVGHPEAIRGLLVRVLVAPAFLYRIEAPSPEKTPGMAGMGTVPLTSWELASRLSYFLGSSPPDEPLLQDAAAGKLNDADVLKFHTERMLTSPKAQRFVEEFFGQWFGFYRFADYRGIDADRFPEFNGNLRAAMYAEAVATFEHIVRQDRPLREILFADYAFLNRRLAEHYRLPDEVVSRLSEQLERVAGVEPYRRGGLLQLGAVHAVTSAPLRTSAVKRGDWILRRVLGTPVPPPPADAGSIPADDVLADGKTVRQRLISHRRQPACVNCHARMDPLGFALETFDPIGRWRSEYRDGQTIDTTGTLHDGTEIDGIQGLHRYLRRRQGDFYRTLSSKLLGYALGRSELLSDRPLIDQIMTDLESGAGLSTIAVRIVRSPQFRNRRAGQGTPHLFSDAREPAINHAK